MECRYFSVGIEIEEEANNGKKICWLQEELKEEIERLHLTDAEQICIL